MAPAAPGLDPAQDHREDRDADEGGDDADGQLGHGGGAGDIVDQQQIDRPDEGRDRQQADMVGPDQSARHMRDHQPDPADDAGGGDDAGGDDGDRGEDRPLDDLDGGAERPGLVLAQG